MLFDNNMGVRYHARRFREFRWTGFIHFLVL